VRSPPRCLLFPSHGCTPGRSPRIATGEVFVPFDPRPVEVLYLALAGSTSPVSSSSAGHDQPLSWSPIPFSRRCWPLPSSTSRAIITKSAGAPSNLLSQWRAHRGLRRTSSGGDAARVIVSCIPSGSRCLSRMWNLRVRIGRGIG